MHYRIADPQEHLYQKQWGNGGKSLLLTTQAIKPVVGMLETHELCICLQKLFLHSTNPHPHIEQHFIPLPEASLTVEIIFTAMAAQGGIFIADTTPG